MHSSLGNFQFYVSACELWGLHHLGFPAFTQTVPWPFLLQEPLRSSARQDCFWSLLIWRVVVTMSDAWNDTVLVEAFDAAITKYQQVGAIINHGKQ